MPSNTDIKAISAARFAARQLAFEEAAQELQRMAAERESSDLSDGVRRIRWMAQQTAASGGTP